MRAGIPRVDPHWLALRGPADGRARAAADSLAADLARFLRLRRPTAPARLVDVAAGTGSGAAWLRPRLPVAQQWRLIDHDAALLSRAEPAAEGWAQPIVADLYGMADLLAAEPADAVTCQALLDLLPAEGIRALLAPAIASRAAVLAGLTVTGRVRLTPPHSDDDVVGGAFNGHQHRDGRLGPDAAGYASEMLQRHGYAVAEIATPWRLGRTDRALTDAWLRGRAEAAIEQMPSDRRRIERWLADRRSAAHRGRLSATVDHVDLLAVPAGA